MKTQTDQFINFVDAMTSDDNKNLIESIKDAYKVIHEETDVLNEGARARGLMMGLMLAKGAIAGQLDQVTVDNIAVDVVKSMEQLFDGKNSENYIKQNIISLNTDFDTNIYNGNIDSDDKTDIINRVSEIKPEFGKMLEIVDNAVVTNFPSQADNVDPNSEPNSIETDPFNHLSKVTPEEWAENTIKVMNKSKGSEDSFNNLDSLKDFKTNMIKANNTEASEFYNTAIKLLKSKGINFDG